MVINSDFIDIPLKTSTLDLWVVRQSIFKALQKICPSFKGSFLDVGCGKMPYKFYVMSHSGIESYLGLDIDTALVYAQDTRPDMTWDGRTMPLADETFGSAMATEVLEHCFEPELLLKEVCRVLQKDGLFFLTVPFLWPLHEVPFDAYRYTPWSLEQHLRVAGFSQVDIYPLGGWHASMAQMLGLWVLRSELRPSTKAALSLIIKPIINYLVHKDIKPDQFNESSMVTGLYAIAKK